MALLNAGVPLNSMAGAVSCFLLKDGEICFDSLTDDEQVCVWSVTLSLSELILLNVTDIALSTDCCKEAKKHYKSVVSFVVQGSSICQNYQIQYSIFSTWPGILFGLSASHFRSGLTKLYINNITKDVAEIKRKILNSLGENQIFEPKENL